MSAASAREPLVPDAPGRVETRHVRLFTEEEPLVLESGRTLGPVDVAYETYGELAPDGGNVVYVCHALTGDAHAAGHHGDPTRRGWWDNIIGPGRPLDTTRHHVVCANLLGGCQGTTGPSSADPATGRPYGLRFPAVTVRDLVEVHRALLRHLGIRRLHGAIGGSLGGMQVFQWALDHPEEIANAVLVCATVRLGAQSIAFSEVARQAILRDPDFAGGDYYGTGRIPATGLSVARMLAHITYLSEVDLERRFSRERRVPPPADLFGVEFEVESYLHHQGDSFVHRFDANTYLYMTRLMDHFEPLAEDGAEERLRQVATRFLLVSFTTDWRFGTAHSRRILEALEAAGREVTHREIDSPHGHDSFLLALPDYHAAVAEFLR